jgi:conjugative relaxase-like TrwC/TraI family protein
LAVVATLTKGYDLDYIWRQVDQDTIKDAASYYIQASETGGEPPGRWWGPGAKALGLEPGQVVDRKPYDLLFGERKAPDGTQLGRPPDSGKKAADIYAQLLKAEPHATAERKHELRLQATRQARQNPLFFDLTLSLSKSISLFHASLGENARQARDAGDRDGDLYWSALVEEVDAMIWQAVRAGFDYLQREAGYTRTGSHGKRVGGRETGQWHEADLVVAHWLQHTSRDGDMQLHVHSQIAHVARTATDGKWRAPDSLGYNEHVGAVAAITAQHLEEALTRRFGLEWTARDDGHGFEISGISGEMMRLFSSRRQSITADLRIRAQRFEQQYRRAPSQRELAQLAQASNFRTRKGKEGALDFAQLHAGWADKLTRSLGVSLASIAPSVWHANTGAAAHTNVRGDTETTNDRQLELTRAAQKAVALAQQEKSTWTRADLVKYLGRVLPRTSMDPQQAATLLEDLADRALRSEFEPVVCLEAPEPVEAPRSLLRKDGRNIYQRHGGVRYATRAQLTMEERIVAQAGAEGAPRLTREAAARALGADLARLDHALEGHAPDTQNEALNAHAQEQMTGSGLREDQAAAAMSVLSDGRRVSVINAPAGSGKTRVLAELGRMWQESDLGRVIGVTPSQSARNTLAAGVAESYNSAQFLGHLPGQRGARGPVTTGPRPLLLVDEASIIGNEDLADLVSLAEANDGKLVLAGDTAQLQAVQNGGGLSLLADHLGHVQLTEPVRFKAEWERAASLSLRKGDPAALADYDQHARIRGGDPEQMMDAAATAYVALTTADTDTLLMAADHATRKELSRRIRDDLIRLGRVQEGPTITIADGTQASCGDLIICTRNDHAIEAGEPGRHLANGDLLRIEAITEGGPIVRRALDADRQTGQRRWTARQFLFARYEDAEIGYAVTDHVAQGRTVHTGLAVITGTEDRQHAYVALTRGTDTNMAFVFTVSPKLADPAPGPRPAPELARHDRLTASQKGSTIPAENAATSDAVGVLADVLERDGQLLSATQIRQQALSDADHLGVLNAIWTAETTPARTQRYRDLYLSALPPEYRHEPGHQAKWLWQTLRTAELAGLDPSEALAAAIGQRDLVGARDIPSVIDARLRHHLGSLTPLPAGTWSGQLPEISDPERRAYATQIATLMDERKDRIGAHASTTAPAWAIAALGPVPDTQPDLERWQQRAASIGAWRELSGHDHPTDPIGPKPGTGSPDLRAAWHEARAALGPADGPDVRGMPDGILLHLRDTYPIETAWAPPWRGEELRQVRTAAWDARLAALRAAAEANTATKNAQHDEATRQQALAASYHALHDAYQQRETALAAAMTDRATWEEATRHQRQLAIAADAELRRRHPGQHHHPLRSAEPHPVPRTQHDDPTPSAASTIAQTANRIAEIAAERREFAHHFAERNVQISPPGNSQHADLDAVPLARAGQVRDAILQPPKPAIEPSARILERVADPGLDLEAAD